MSGSIVFCTHAIVRGGVLGRSQVVDGCLRCGVAHTYIVIDAALCSPDLPPLNTLPRCAVPQVFLYHANAVAKYREKTITPYFVKYGERLFCWERRAVGAAAETPPDLFPAARRTCRGAAAAHSPAHPLSARLAPASPPPAAKSKGVALDAAAFNTALNALLGKHLSETLVRLSPPNQVKTFTVSVTAKK